MRVAVVGARRNVQGTGEFVAREFARRGCPVVAVVGTSVASTEAAQQALGEHYGIDCAGYTSLPELLAQEQVDVVAVCSPHPFHLAQVEAALAGGCHVFSEKPLWWEKGLTREAIERAVGRLAGLCEETGRYLALNTQWPFTLPAFAELHPGVLDQPLRRFSMLLSPNSQGATMLVDAGSHLLSMLHALSGVQELSQVRVQCLEGPEGLRLEARYGSDVQVEFELRRSQEIPRPAAYAVNGHRVVRHIELPDYTFAFEDQGRRVPVPDPLGTSVDEFVQAVRNGRQTDSELLLAGMTQLLELVAQVDIR